MPSRKDPKRRAWLEYGAEALHRARPEAPRVYGCPLCLRGSDSPAAFTLEDVPPRSIGGRPLVLTCGPCNHISGHLLDSNILAGHRLKEIAKGKRQAAIKLTQFGQTISAKATFGPGSLLIAGVPEKSDPKAHKTLFEELDRAVASGSQDWGFSITLPVRYSPWREAVGWLRVAYLYAFAALGYNFIMRPELNPVREQIRRPDERVVPGIIKHTGSLAEGDGISFVHWPMNFRSVLVRLGHKLFFFPDFNYASGFYERLANIQESSETLTLSGLHIDLPRRPRFAFDYESKLMWLTVPPEERPAREHGT